MDFAEIFYRLSVAIIPVLMGIVLHEIAHAYAAYSLGDNTAKDLGRLTLNPIKHLDRNGLMLFVLTAVLSPFVFGWAKPVPVNPRRFTKIRNIKSGMLIVSLAGPLTNFFLAIFFAFALKLYIPTIGQGGNLSSFNTFILDMLSVGIGMNLVLMILNLLPIPPLDGSHFIAKILPYPYDYKYMEMGRYGTIVILILLATNVLGYIMQFFLNLLYPIITIILK